MANRHKPLPARVRVAQAADAALARHLGWEKWPLKRQLSYIFSTEGNTNFLTRIEPHSVLAELHQWCVAGITSNEERWRTQHFLKQLAQRRTTLFTRPEVALGLAHIGRHFNERVRELDTWQPRSKNPFQQLISLVRHLFDRYGDVPAWVLHRWGHLPDPNYRFCYSKLFVHLGQGQTFRSFTRLPLAPTKRQEHFMRQAPAGCTYQEAYRYAQLAEREATEWLGVALASRLGREPLGPDDGLWLAVLERFRDEAAQAEAWQFGAVCDWIHFRRHVGTATEPAQPGFSLRGRTLASLLAHAARWQRTQRQPRNFYRSKLLEKAWAGLPVPDSGGGAGDWVRIRQLLSYPELLAEGQQMRHCVTSYVHQCVRGKAGIYSLTFNGSRMLTLEVSPERELVQARGKHNRPPSYEERRWVEHWLQENHITSGSHVWA